ncbi:MAG: tripartite tricarboxylate transporter substrate binding protein [Hylemonella sp.]|uniref:Bug family tripartite tricarboxylate transporter substrate binding protein n=1 Tax=Hylemonella sp. TaxID=2066020 RepID=UPI0022BB575A|nr:tripartite tricarboxylate transporter substrate binding protein [Hylemonella sp.]MCZ8252313.1 tripartite tricarboxylate transporter substrate binding protein [Hylemonella sp.]
MPFKIASHVLRRTALGALVAAAGLLPMAQAQAQAYPSKPVKVIVSFPPGGVADVLARLVAAPLQDALGQPVVVENRAGSGGNIGADAVAKSPADGYTLLMSSGGTVSVNPHIYPKMPFDPNKDIVPVASVARVAVFLLARNNLPVNNAKEFIDYLKANPGKLSYGSPGNGSSPHLAGEMFKSMSSTFAVHVPYRGAAPALNDLLAGQIDYAFDPGIGLTHVRAGRLKLLAVGSPKRSSLFPDVPTVEEAGLKGFDADTYFGFYAPAGTPAAVVTRLNTEINKILSTPATKERIAALGGEAVPMSPQAFAAKAAEDSKRFGKLIKERGITGD